MSVIAFVLVLISAIAHAGWNFYGKKHSPTLAFFFLISALGALVLSPLLLLYTDLIASLSAEIWMWFVVTGLFQCSYFWGLARAYKAGDMSIAYPIARSSPLVLVCISAFILGQSDSLSNTVILGIVLIVGSCFLVPMKHFKDLKLSNYANSMTMFALVAAVSTACYSIVDDHATRLMREINSELIGATSDLSFYETHAVPLVYVILQGFSSSLWMAIFVFADKHSRRQVTHLIHNSMAHCITAALMVYGTYALVLASMGYVTNVSYVVAFRQISIPIGVFMGMIWLGEKFYPPKILGVTIMLVGLTAVALG